jgi:DNA repair protein RadC
MHQEAMEFIGKDHSQGSQPLGVKQTAPVPRKRKRSDVIRGRYAYSIKTSRVKEPDFPYTGKQVTCTTDLLDFARSLQTSDIEKMLAVFLDAQNQIIGIHITSGTVNQAMVYPREIVRNAILAGACAIILIHNHPSGHPRPSDADIRLTKTVAEIGKFLDLMVHDHIIIGTAERFFSFREEGLM